MRAGHTLPRWIAASLAAAALWQAGCATKVHDARTTPPAEARHCQDSEMNTSTHIAMLPIPVVAFFTPRVTANGADSSKFLAKCGGKQQVNRRVEANYAACVPTMFLTTIITLGVVGVCPTYVQYQADVVE